MLCERRKWLKACGAVRQGMIMGPKTALSMLAGALLGALLITSNCIFALNTYTPWSHVCMSCMSKHSTLTYDLQNDTFLVQIVIGTFLDINIT